MAADSLVRDPAPGRSRRRKVGRVVAALCAWSCFGVAGTGLLVRFLDTGNQVLIILAAVAWVLALFSVPALLVHLVARNWVSAAIVAALIVGQLVVYLPMFVARTAPAGGTTVRVMTQNMYLGQADAAAIVARVRSEKIDVLAVQELTPDARRRLEAAGLDAVLPNAWAQERAGASGSGIWSRFPLDDLRAYPGFGMATLSAHATLPDGKAISLVCVHPGAPYPAAPTFWLREMARLRDVLAEQSAGPVIVAGDFNATVDTARFRRLLTGGYQDGAGQAGAGVVRSWPADRAVPPTIGIDHVLTRDAVATSITSVRTAGSDHLGLVASLSVG